MSLPLQPDPSSRSPLSSSQADAHASPANAGAAPKRSPLEDLLDAFNSKSQHKAPPSKLKEDPPCTCPICTAEATGAPLEAIPLGDFLKLLGVPSVAEKLVPPPRHFITLRLLWNHFRFILSLPRPLRALLLQNTTASTSGKIPLSALRALRDSLKAYLDADRLKQSNSNGLYAFILYSACVTLTKP
jgi:hypothetical protein